MTTNDDRADQIRARLAAATPGPWWTGWDQQEFYVTAEARPPWNRVAEWTYAIHPGNSVEQDECDTRDADLIANAPADLAWLLAERAELLRRVEQAERAGAVKALRSAGRAVAEDINLVSYQTGLTIEKFMERRAGATENGADL